MPTLYELKPRFQGVLRPLVKRLATAGVTPNQVTIATGAASVILGAGLTLAHRGWVLLPLFLFVRMALNAIDGMLAREHGQESKLGAVLNELIDVISDAALTMPFATLPGWSWLSVASAIFFAALCEIAGVTGLALGGARRYDGPFGKSDRALVLGVLGSWLALGWPVSRVVRRTAPVLWIVLCCATIVHRLLRALARAGTPVGRVANAAREPARSGDAGNAGHWRGAATKPEPGAVATRRACRIWADSFVSRRRR